MEKLIGDILQHVIEIITPLAKKLAKHFVLTIFFLLYLVAFWFLFFTKGAYINGHFYKKSANLTTITYSARSPLCDFDTVVLQKHVDGALITVDDVYTIDVHSDGSWTYTGYMSNIEKLDGIDWQAVASQSNEKFRGFGGKWWIFTLALMAAAYLFSRYSTEIYSFFNRNRAANENYYLWVGRISKAVYVLGLIYLIIPL